MTDQQNHSNSILIPEMLTEIFEHLVPDPDYTSSASPGKKDLLSCALSCKMFASLALKSMWRQMDNLLPLLKLLPGLRLVNNYYVLTNVLAPADFTRYDYYAALVKEYSHSQEEEENPDEPVFPRINASVYFCVARFRPTLLPSLTIFTCYADAFDSRIELNFFASPSLKDVSIYEVNSLQKTTEILMYLSLLGFQAPDIRVLKLSVNQNTPTSCFQTVSNLKNLRFLHLSFEEGETGFPYNTVLPDIEALGVLEHLEDLHVQCYIRSNLVPNAYTSPSFVASDALGSLKRLTVHGDYVLAKTLFNLCQYSPIQRLDYVGDYLPRMSSLIEQVAVQWEKTLEEVYFIRYFQCRGQQPEALELGMDLRPLCLLSNLKILILMATAEAMAIIVGDEDIIAMAEALPLLENLRLDLLAENLDSPPSVAVLKVLACRCPRLKRIQMPLNVVAVPEPTPNHSVSSLGPPSTHGLEHFEMVVNLSLLKERVQEVRVGRLAYYIWSAFPHVRSVYGTWSFEIEYLWKGLGYEVKKLQNRDRELERTGGRL
ncbi:hypothetical protein VKT23_016325 [Stygiomarasmius scandens]|uniref:F-box domain-containing protein n=1 Tax=Marasmiellus scandens TaxID=2682957 RepID=A0ABR1IVI2_9AGAR